MPQGQKSLGVCVARLKGAEALAKSWRSSGSGKMAGEITAREIGTDNRRWEARRMRKEVKLAKYQEMLRSRQRQGKERHGHRIRRNRLLKPEDNSGQRKRLAAGRRVTRSKMQKNTQGKCSPAQLGENGNSQRAISMRYGVLFPPQTLL